MNINHVPISPHNAEAWQLEQIDIDMTLRSPDQNGILTLCDYSSTGSELATISLAALTDNRGFIAKRTDDKPIQAQYVRPDKAYDPQGKHVFIDPVEFVPVRHDLTTERWRVDVDPDNVDDPAGLNMLVWALAHYGLKKKKKMLVGIQN